MSRGEEEIEIKEKQNRGHTINVTFDSFSDWNSISKNGILFLENNILMRKILKNIYEKV